LYEDAGLPNMLDAKLSSCVSEKQNNLGRYLTIDHKKDLAKFYAPFNGKAL
jgi:hypothetical protein